VIAGGDVVKRCYFGAVIGAFVGALTFGISYYFAYNAGLDYLNNGNAAWTDAAPQSAIGRTSSHLFSFPVNVEFWGINGLLAFPFLGGLFSATTAWLFHRWFDPPVPPRQIPGIDWAKYHEALREINAQLR
jgi:hypothetical protein